MFAFNLPTLILCAVSLSVQGFIHMLMWGSYKVKVPKIASWSTNVTKRLRLEFLWSLFSGFFFSGATLLTLLFFSSHVTLTSELVWFMLMSFSLWAAFVNAGGEFLHLLFTLNQTQELIEHDKNEVIKLKREVLQDLISPHFLFNSLNTVSSVISENRAKSIRFVKELSDLYGFMLKNSHKSVVSLGEDMVVAEKYAFLLKTRLESGIEVVFDVPKVFNAWLLPPMTLQNLVENCVKHNVVSKKKVLFISVFVDGDFLVVRNNLNLKMNSGVGSTHLGLDYICSQIEQLSEEEVIISQSKDEFIVLIPLIYEHTRKVTTKISGFSKAKKDQ